jgi:hypothetical protein
MQVDGCFYVPVGELTLLLVSQKRLPVAPPIAFEIQLAPLGILTSPARFIVDRRLQNLII